MADAAIPAVREHAEEGPQLRHHFATPEQQYEASALGMWGFLVTEVLFFSGMFTAYAVYRSMYPAAFASTSHYMNVPLGAVNTAILALSTLTMALSVRSAQLNKLKSIPNYLIVTMILGVAFLCIKGYEYHMKWVEHVVPGFNFSYENVQFAHHAAIFFWLYFVMTGMHALHMVVGEGLLIWLLVKAYQRQFTGKYFTPLRMIGMYWEFVDIIWIFLFPLFYVVGGRS